MTKPFLKWVGGKTNLLPTLLEQIPTDFENYYEPFIGGGALFFELFDKGLLENKKIVLSDLNWRLINTYIQIRDYPNDVINNLKDISNWYNNLETIELQKIFYEKSVRGTLNSATYFKDKLTKSYDAAMFLIYNRICFNGLYRENSRGQINTAFGTPKKYILDVDNIKNCSKALQNVELKICSYSDLTFEENSFVYYDPPYIPLTIGGHTKYVKEEFSQQDLKNFFVKNSSTKQLLSNTKCDKIIELYNGFEIIETNPIYRSISGKAEHRKNITEYLVKNY